VDVARAILVAIVGFADKLVVNQIRPLGHALEVLLNPVVIVLQDVY